MFATLLQGFVTGGSLIVAIGAQNAFVLSQGVHRQYHWQVALFCMCSDALLISAGMLGMGAFAELWPNGMQWMLYGGIAFLFVYGALSFKSAMTDHSLKAGQVKTSLRSAMLMVAFVSFANPHVYLDTVILLGTIGEQFEGAAKNSFWLGAVIASVCWFVLLTSAARMLAPWLAKPSVWRGIELAIGVMMWLLASLMLWRVTYG